LLLLVLLLVLLLPMLLLPEATTWYPARLSFTKQSWHPHRMSHHH
jgi:hypothetical protein